MEAGITTEPKLNKQVLKPTEVGKLLNQWEVYELIETEVKYRLENADEFDEELSEETLRESLYEDSLFLQDQWDFLIEDLTELIKERNPNGYWHCELNNFGWRNSNGYKDFSAETGQDLLRAILPDTDCTFKIFEYGEKGFAIQNWHHDSLMGNEWYYIAPICETCDLKLKCIVDRLEDDECPKNYM